MLLQLIIQAPDELMDRKRHLLGAIQPILEEMAGRGVREHTRQMLLLESELLPWIC